MGQAYADLAGSCWISRLSAGQRLMAAFVAREVLERSTGLDSLEFGHRPMPASCK